MQFVSLDMQLKARFALLCAFQGYSPPHRHTTPTCQNSPCQLYSKCKIFWEMSSKRNRVLESDSKKKRQTQRQTMDWLTTDNLNLVHLSSIGLQGVEGCFNVKPSHTED